MHRFPSFNNGKETTQMRRQKMSQSNSQTTRDSAGQPLHVLIFSRPGWGVSSLPKNLQEGISHEDAFCVASLARDVRGRVLRGDRDRKFRTMRRATMHR